MDPQLKLIIDDLKTVSASMVDLKTSLSDHIKGVEKSIGDRFRSMEEVAQVFEEWKPKVDAAMDDLRGEVGALRKSVSRVVLDSSSPTAAGIFAKPGSVAATLLAGNPTDGPDGHRHENSH